MFYNEVRKRLKSRLFLALGTEGKKIVQINPHIEISKLEFRDMVRLAKVSFEKTKNITYERYRLFSRAQESGEALESFHVALTAQAATAELGGLEEELVRDLFISRMKNFALQDILTFKTFAPDEVLKRAIKFEQKFCPLIKNSAQWGTTGDVVWSNEPYKPSNEDWDLCYWTKMYDQ